MINLLPLAIYFAPLVKVSFLSLLSTSSLFFRSSIMLCLGMNFFVFINCLGFSQLLESVSLSFAWFGKFQPLCLRKKPFLEKKTIQPRPHFSLWNGSDTNEIFLLLSSASLRFLFIAFSPCSLFSWLANFCCSLWVYSFFSLFSLFCWIYWGL